MSQGSPFCSVVILNYNGKDLLEKFLPSVVNLEYPNYEIVIVDNASSDGSIEFIKSKYPNCKLVINNENFGTAEGSNIGARQTKGEYVFWLSNDMELEPKMLNYMIEKAESDKSIGICTCKMRRITQGGKGEKSSRRSF